MLKCVIKWQAEWLIMFFEQTNVISLFLMQLTVCFSQKYAQNISQGFLHQKHDISFPLWSLELKAVFATVLLDLYAIEKTLK